MTILNGSPTMHDVIVIGAGPVGLASAIEAQRVGLDTLTFDKGAIVQSLQNYPTQMEFFSTPELLEIGDYPFSTNRYKPTREEAIDYYIRVTFAENLNLKLYEPVNDIQGDDGDFKVVTAEAIYRTRKVIVALGFFGVPNLLNIPGEELPKVTHYFHEPYPYAGQHVAVIGARNSAAKAALACFRNKAKVTLIARGSEISDRVKYWIKPDLENRIKEGSIDALFNTRVTSIHLNHLELETPDGHQQLDNDWVLAMTGYRPNFDLLHSFGIEMADDEACTPIYDDETFETSRAGVYLAGTVCGGLDTSRWFIENGRHHARQIAKHISSTIPTPA